MKPSGNIQPVLVTEIELSKPLEIIRGKNSKNTPQYGAALVVVRLHHMILGTIEIKFNGTELNPQKTADAIWRTYSEKINRHLEKDGSQPIQALPIDGISIEKEPKCLTSLNTYLEEAPLVSVIVCTHDRTNLLRDSLPKLLSLNYPNYEVIVVDNAPSTQETYEYIHEVIREYDLVRYVREDQPGLSWARNCGIKASKADYIAFTDDDAHVDPYWLAFLMQTLSENEAIGCVTGLALPLELEHEAQIWFEQFGGLGNGFERLEFDLNENRSDHILYPYTVGQYGAGVNMAFRKDVLLKLKGFNVQINQADDISMFVKIITNGFRIVYDPNGFVYHKHREDYNALRQQIYSYGIGLSQFLIYLIISDWTWLFRVAPRIPAAVIHLLSPKSYKNQYKEKGYPSELTWLERKGILAGPFKYLQYARQIRSAKSNFE